MCCVLCAKCCTNIFSSNSHISRRRLCHWLPQHKEGNWSSESCTISPRSCSKNLAETVRTQAVWPQGSEPPRKEAELGHSETDPEQLSYVCSILGTLCWLFKTIIFAWALFLSLQIMIITYRILKVSVLVPTFSSGLYIKRRKGRKKSHLSCN